MFEINGNAPSKSALLPPPPPNISIHTISLSHPSINPSFHSSVTLLPLPRLHAVPVILQQSVSVAIVVQVLSFVYFNAKLHRHCEKSLIGDFSGLLVYRYIYIYIFLLMSLD